MKQVVALLTILLLTLGAAQDMPAGAEDTFMLEMFALMGMVETDCPGGTAPDYIERCALTELPLEAFQAAWDSHAAADGLPFVPTPYSEWELDDGLYYRFYEYPPDMFAVFYYGSLVEGKEGLVPVSFPRL